MNVRSKQWRSVMCRESGTQAVATNEESADGVSEQDLRDKTRATLV